jgi:hypothetical protein
MRIFSLEKMQRNRKINNLSHVANELKVLGTNHSIANSMIQKNITLVAGRVEIKGRGELNLYHVRILLPK